MPMQIRQMRCHVLLLLLLLLLEIREGSQRGQ